MKDWTKDRLNISAAGQRFASTNLGAPLLTFFEKWDRVCAIRGALILTVLSTLLLIAAQPAQAQIETVPHSFAGPPDGADPVAQLVFDEEGNLYGTTSVGGSGWCPGGCGTIFELTVAGRERVLYSFGSQSNIDGIYPDAGLIFDKKGNLYGTTFSGGAYGYGTIFELTAKGTEKVLYSFSSQTDDGSCPEGLIFDKEGNLYGTTYSGGAYGYGTIFELTAKGTEKVLYSFGSQADDGGSLLAGLIFDKEGNLYGTTFSGGAYGGGTIFELTAAGTEKVLYSFGSQPGDGVNPGAGLIFDEKGSLYTTTAGGGAYGIGGTIFELTADGTGKVLHSFGGEDDGAFPYAGLIFDEKGNLYGTTVYGGACSYASYGCGTVFELTAAGTEKVLYSFGGFLGDGADPNAGLIFDKKGNLHGTTSDGGLNGDGTVFEVNPSGRATKTSATLKSSQNPSTEGQQVTFTATVTPAPPDGETVSFMDGSTEMGIGTLSSGSATYWTSALPMGKSTITAVYGGDTDFAASTSKAVKQTVKE
jgi:uncharacterized repeat protein (TIGR03803 family)